MDRSDIWSSIDLSRIRNYLLVLARSCADLSGEDASDIVQRTLTVAFARRHQFQGQSEGQLAAWLKQILRFQLIDAHRRTQLKKNLTGAEVPLDESLIDSSIMQLENRAAALPRLTDCALTRDELLLRLAEALAQLPTVQREAIVQHHLQMRPLAEIASELDRTPGAVAGLLHRGLKKLRETLTGMDLPTELF